MPEGIPDKCLIHISDICLNSQSPLHRGLYSDLVIPVHLTVLPERHNPLFIGACILTKARYWLQTRHQSHNPLFIGACILTSSRWLNEPNYRGHNPLFIGACILTNRNSG